MTTMKIREVFDRDPLLIGLANNGQARITQGQDERVVRELRAELETFVCEGQFADAIERILDRYLAGIDAPRQEAVWVSGFYGSGKSHLLKMLAHLWVNTRFDDGQTARGLVADRLPHTVRDALRELDTFSTRLQCDPVATAGTLLGGNVEHVRRSVLAIMLRACGLPEQYGQASFCIWLRREGLLDEVRERVEGAGKSWERELKHLYVSPVISGALLDARPGLAEDAKDVRQLLTKQFSSPRTDISNLEFIQAAQAALAPSGGNIPPTIVVLDEVQQYINEASDRAQIVTDVAEALQSQFDSRVLLVASGQSALAGGNAALTWLRDRFRVTVQLADAEVEVVTRRVLLTKKPSAVQDVQNVLDHSDGEISRHLLGTRLKRREEDKDADVGDYPLLRTRRRFWEHVFRSTDASGSKSQLRSQLRILHDSLREIGERPLGVVIPTSQLFDALAQDLVASSVLLNEIHTRIKKLDDGTEDGKLKADLCGVAFLIGKLPREKGVDAGVRADANTLADLLLDDIRSDSGAYRNRIKCALDSLAAEGVLMSVGDEYRIQTREGAEWERAFREERTRLTKDVGELNTLRGRLIRRVVDAELRHVRPVQGEAREKRTVTAHYGMERPMSRRGSDVVWVWVRDDWTCSEKQVRGDAREAGMEDSRLYVHLPKKSAQDLAEYVASAAAAQKVIEGRGIPTSPEGKDALEGIKSHLERARSGRDRIIEEVVHSARVFNGGGTEVHDQSLRAKVRSGAQTSVQRLFPRFKEGDHASWEIAFKRIREGTGTPFAAVGWDGPVGQHQVAKEVMREVGSGATGGTVRAALTTEPFGWPNAAIDAALAGLVAADLLNAQRQGVGARVRDLTHQTIRTTHFRPEKVPLTPEQRIAVRGLFQDLGIRTRGGEEATKANQFLEKCRELSRRAGGNAPLPKVPDTSVLDHLTGLTGNQQLAEILAHQDWIREESAKWKELGERARDRHNAWALAEALYGHAHGSQGRLDQVAHEVARELRAIHDQRSLLADDDPVAKCVARLGDALRRELHRLHERLADQINRAIDRLGSDPTWAKLESEAQCKILSQAKLVTPGELQVGTNPQLCEELDRRRLEAWRSEIDAVLARERRALNKAREIVGPGVVRIRVARVTLKDEEAVRNWVDEHQEKLTAAVRKGPVIIE